MRKGNCTLAVTLVAIMVLGAAMPASSAAETIDFEVALPEGTVLTTLAGYPGVSFTGGVLVVPGLPSLGFDGNSSGIGAGSMDDANSGQTVTSEGPTTTPIVITFDQAVGDVSVDLVDVEAYQDGAGESAIVSVFDVATGGTPIFAVVVDYAGLPFGDGDGELTHVNLSGFAGDHAIRRLEVARYSGDFGWAIDNIGYDFGTTSARSVSWGSVKRHAH